MHPNTITWGPDLSIWERHIQTGAVTDGKLRDAAGAPTGPRGWAGPTASSDWCPSDKRCHRPPTQEDGFLSPVRVPWGPGFLWERAGAGALPALVSGGPRLTGGDSTSHQLSIPGPPGHVPAQAECLLPAPRTPHPTPRTGCRPAAPRLSELGRGAVTGLGCVGRRGRGRDCAIERCLRANAGEPLRRPPCLLPRHRRADTEPLPPGSPGRRRR